MSIISSEIEAQKQRDPSYVDSGLQWAWSDGYIAGLSAALWAVVTADGVNRTGCKHFDLHNPGQKEMDLEH